MRKKNRHKTIPPKTATKFKATEQAVVQQNISPTPTNSTEKEEPKLVYAWPASLRGRRFIISVAIFGLITVTLFGFTYITFGPFGSGIASIVLGVFGGILVNTIEKEQGANYKLAIPWTPQSWLGIAFLSIILFQVIDLLVRFWLLPWRLAYGPSFNTSAGAMIGVLFFDFGGLILCGILIGYLIPTRAVTAAIIGASIYTGMGLIEAYTGVASYSNYTFIASYMNADISAEDYQGFRLGLVVGLVLRGALAIIVARYIARRRIRKGLVYR